MQQHAFTDRQIEEYIDGSFNGDVVAIEHYLHGTEEGRQRLAYHKAFYGMLQSGPEPQLSISLSNAVMNTLANRQVKKARTRDYLVWIAGGIAGVSLLVYVVMLLDNMSWPSLTGISPVWITLVIALLVIAFHGIDLREQQRRYRDRMLT